jgi:hypothetical protein
VEEVEYVEEEPDEQQFLCYSPVLCGGSSVDTIDAARGQRAGKVATGGSVCVFFDACGPSVAARPQQQANQNAKAARPQQQATTATAIEPEGGVYTC